jgi:hypothetical protein
LTESSLRTRRTIRFSVRVFLAALQLIKQLDSRRFRRLQRHITWIVNCPLPKGGGQYHYPTRTCRLDVEKGMPKPDADYAAAAIASTLIHEATHGVLRARGIGYSAQLRARVERCCVREQNRFLGRLCSSRPDIAKFLHREFTESGWHCSWTATRLQSLSDLIRRLRRETI